MPPSPSDDADDTRPSARPVHVGGDYVGRDKITNQTAGGDIVGGDKITTTYGDPAAAATLAEAFKRIDALIAARKEDPAVEKDEIKETVGRIAAEAQKGDEASTPKVERWLRTLGQMAPDIWQVTTATLANPALGLATAIRLIAQKAQQEAKGAAGG